MIEDTKDDAVDTSTNSDTHSNGYLDDKNQEDDRPLSITPKKHRNEGTYRKVH